MWKGLTMHPEAKQAWVADLRSGNRKKGRGYLRLVKKKKDTEVSSFCCLGVFSEIQNVPCKYEVRGDGGEAHADYSYPTGNSGDEMPDFTWFQDFFEWDDSFISEADNKFDAVTQLCGHLAGKNDGEGVKKPWSFKQIANWIDKNL